MWGRVLDVINHTKFNSIGSGVSEPQVAEYRYLPLTGGIALTVYALTCYTVIHLSLRMLVHYVGKLQVQICRKLHDVPTTIQPPNSYGSRYFIKS